MKLYTEEQVKKQKEVIEDIIDLWDEGYPLDSHTVSKCKNALLELTPIELPSDEEIEKRAKIYCDEIFSTDMLNGTSNHTRQIYYQTGAKWMKEQILKNNL